MRRARSLWVLAFLLLAGNSQATPIFDQFHGGPGMAAAIEACCGNPALTLSGGVSGSLTDVSSELITLALVASISNDAGVQRSGDVLGGFSGGQFRGTNIPAVWMSLIPEFDHTLPAFADRVSAAEPSILGLFGLGLVLVGLTLRGAPRA